MDSEYILTSDGQLYHWGIKGMKWGQRRYQNKDGSLTAAGKKRYNAEVEKLKAREQVIKNQERVKAKQDKLNAKKAELDAREKALKGDAAEVTKPKKTKFGKKGKAEGEKKKSIADMTDEELKKMIDRARLEDTYRQLRPEPTPKKNKMIAALEPVMIEAGKNMAKAALDRISNEVLGKKVSNMPEMKTWEDYVKREHYRKSKRENDAEEQKAKKAREEAEAAEKKAREEAEAAEKKAREDAKAAAKKEKEDAKAAAKKEKEDAKAAEKKRKEEEREALRKAREEEAEKYKDRKHYDWYYG